MVEPKKTRKSSFKEPFIFAIELLEFGSNIATETMSDFRCRVVSAQWVPVRINRTAGKKRQNEKKLGPNQRTEEHQGRIEPAWRHNDYTSRFTHCKVIYTCIFMFFLLKYNGILCCRLIVTKSSKDISDKVYKNTWLWDTTSNDAGLFTRIFLINESSSQLYEQKMSCLLFQSIKSKDLKSRHLRHVVTQGPFGRNRGWTWSPRGAATSC